MILVVGFTVSQIQSPRLVTTKLVPHSLNIISILFLLLIYDLYTLTTFTIHPPPRLFPPPLCSWADVT